MPRGAGTQRFAGDVASPKRNVAKVGDWMPADAHTPSMRQVWITKTGSPEVLVVKEASDPESKAGEVRVRVRASGINFADLMARVGLYPDAPKLPCVVGYEVSGVVDQIGGGVVGLREGDRVLAMCRFGGYSDTVVLPSHQARKMPDKMSFEEGAAFPVVYL